eukprot:5142736-Prorocentrum_lima.AAC.1
MPRCRFLPRASTSGKVGTNRGCRAGASYPAEAPVEEVGNNSSVRGCGPGLSLGVAGEGWGSGRPTRAAGATGHLR